jgi:hypothetical protein
VVITLYLELRPENKRFSEIGKEKFRFSKRTRAFIGFLFEKNSLKDVAIIEGINSWIFIFVRDKFILSNFHHFFRKQESLCISEVSKIAIARQKSSKNIGSILGYSGFEARVQIFTTLSLRSFSPFTSFLFVFPIKP